MSPKTLFLPAGMRLNKPANADRQMPLAAAIGHPGAGLDHFIAELDMPPSLRLVKIGPESSERIAGQAIGRSWVPHIPRRIDGPAHVREILQLAA